MKEWIMELCPEIADWQAELIVDHVERLVRHEREAIATMFDEPMHLIPHAQNDLGGCLVCGFTPKLVASSIRARRNK